MKNEKELLNEIAKLHEGDKQNQKDCIEMQKRLYSHEIHDYSEEKQTQKELNRLRVLRRSEYTRLETLTKSLALCRTKQYEFTKEDIGKTVVYNFGTDRVERGVITSMNDTYVFVRYGDKINSQATKPEDLTFE